MTGGQENKWPGASTATTELLRQGSSSWEYSGELPFATQGLRAATLYNKLIVTGRVTIMDDF